MDKHRDETDIFSPHEKYESPRFGKSSQTLREQMDALNEHMAVLEKEIFELKGAIIAANGKKG